MDATRRRLLSLAGASLFVPGARVAAADLLDVRHFGATGDGHTLDSPAINRAIDAAAQGGGGTVRFRAGTYASHSIRLRSGVTLLLESGATILAARMPRQGRTSGGYDAAESNAPWAAYQDFGHNHWHNSLIWGENLHDIAIMGPGLLSGLGLSRSCDFDPDLPVAQAPGAANKAVALKNCHNVILRDFSILKGGHFGILATGVDNLVIDGLRIDTNRDGMDIDCCRYVTISNCIVNSPEDDGICLKSSYALGYARPTENISITGCHVTGGYQIGTVLNGSFRRRSSGHGRRAHTGRIKAGTESNGGFRNITVSGCTFESCRGFALETVDGGLIEDVTFTGVTMRDIGNAPFFLRLGARMRGPSGVPVGRLRRVILSDIVCEANAAMPSVLSGIPGHAIEDIRIENVVIRTAGGGTADMAAAQVPEQEQGYPEPERLGPLPAAGFFIRHARNLEISNVELEFASADARPAFVLKDVEDASFFHLSLPHGGTPAFSLQDVERFTVSGSAGLVDMSLTNVPQRRI
jgi:polygalacturonase